MRLLALTVGRPRAGLDELALFWDAERDGPDEAFTMSSEVVAVDADTAVVRVWVEYDNDPDTPVARPVGAALRRRGAVRGVRGMALRPRHRTTAASTTD